MTRAAGEGVAKVSGHTSDATAEVFVKRGCASHREEQLPRPDGTGFYDGADNLVSIYAAFSEKTKQAVLDEIRGAQFSAFKTSLSDLIVAKLSPVAGEMRRLLNEPAELDKLLHRGAEQARAIAAPVIADVRRVVGFVG